jgi:cholesterol 24-hydroxylase
LKLLQDGSYVPQDLLTITLKSYANETFDMEDMIDDFITFFIAGQETTGKFLTNCLFNFYSNNSSMLINYS